MSSLLDRMLAVREASRGPNDPATRRILTGVAAAVFVVGSAVGIDRLDVKPADVQWPLIVLAAGVGVPLTALVNAWEYATTARILGHRPGFVKSLRVSVLGTAANLLPVPGATLVRLRELRTMGSGYRAATWVTIAVGLVWIGTSSLLVGAFLLATRTPGLGAVFLLAGFGAIVFAFVGLSSGGVAGRERLPALTRILMVEVILVAVNVFRQGLILVAIGAEAPLAGAFVLVLSAALAAAAGVFPGGLGLRELLSAFMAPIAGVGIATGFVGAAFNRVLGTLGHAVLAVALGIRKSHAQLEIPSD